jgi:MYXO-CTERM domain-containing protein
MRLIVLALLAGLCGTLAASTFTVTNLNDTGAGSLRDAMTAAEANAGADDIVFAGTLNLPGTITLQSALPDITQDLTITGPADDDLIVRRNTAAAAFRIFTITGGTVDISRLWLGDGRATSIAPAVAEGGCIRNGGTLTLVECLIFDCQAVGGSATVGAGGTAIGGAILSNAALTLENVAIIECSAVGGDTSDGTANPGGAAGGGVAASATLTMLGCQVDRCVARAGINSTAPTMVTGAIGGGLRPQQTTVIRDSDITGCQTIGSAGMVDGGAGIGMDGTASLDMRRSSVRGCSGIGVILNGASLLENCTISANVGVDYGGVVFAAFFGVNMSYCTIYDNSSNAGCGGATRVGGTVNMLGSIIAGNTGTNPDVQGTFTDQGFNLVGDSTGSTSFTTSTLVGDSLNPINPNLGAIQNLGATWGHVPLFGSFAIDQGGGASPIDDQRGGNRLFGAPPDIGAVEFIPNQPPSFSSGPTITVDNDGDEVTIAGWATNISPGVSWEAGQSLTFTITGNFFSFREPPEIDPDTGDLTFEPWDGDQGVFVCDVILHDNGGTAGGGQDTSSTSILVIELEDDGDDDDLEDEDFECTTGAGRNHAWLGLLGLLGLLGWRLRRT